MKPILLAVSLGVAIASPRLEAADVRVRISYAAPDALEVRYELPEGCTRLPFQGNGAGYAEIRAGWKSSDQCGSVDGDALTRKAGASCRSVRFRVPTSTDKVTGYPGAFPIGEAIYAHTSKYSVGEACGRVDYQFQAPGSIAVQGVLHQHNALLDGVAGADTAVLLLPAKVQPANGAIEYFDPALSAEAVARIREVADGTISFLRAALPDAPFRMPVLAASRTSAPGDPTIGGDADDVLRLTLFNWPQQPGSELQQQMTKLVAHEFSHRFQQRDAVDVYPDARLIHEGGGEFLRWLVSVKKGWLTREQAARELDESLAECMIGTGKSSWADLPRSYTAAHRLEYSCGLASYAYGLAARTGAGDALSRFGGFYKAIQQGARPDFAQALECGPETACEARWLPSLLGKDIPMPQAWEAMLSSTGLAKASAPNAGELDAMMRDAIVQAVQADCDGQSSTTPTSEGMIIDGLSVCTTLRTDKYVVAVEGLPVFGSSLALSTMVAACAQRGVVRLGMKDGTSLMLTCHQPYPVRKKFFRADIERVLAALDRSQLP